MRSRFTKVYFESLAIELHNSNIQIKELTKFLQELLEYVKTLTKHKTEPVNWNKYFEAVNIIKQTEILLDREK